MDQMPREAFDDMVALVEAHTPMYDEMYDKIEESLPHSQEQSTNRERSLSRDKSSSRKPSFSGQQDLDRAGDSVHPAKRVDAGDQNDPASAVENAVEKGPNKHSLPTKISESKPVVAPKKNAKAQNAFAKKLSLAALERLRASRARNEEIARAAEQSPQVPDAPACSNLRTATLNVATGEVTTDADFPDSMLLQLGKSIKRKAASEARKRGNGASKTNGAQGGLHVATTRRGR